MTENEIAKEIVDAAFKVHTTLGPGLLESVYETCLAHELKKRAFRVARQQVVPVVYDSLRLDEGFRADPVVEDKVIVELKAVKELASEHKAQLLNYLKATDHEVGLLLNFGPKPEVRRMAFENARKAGRVRTAPTN